MMAKLLTQMHLDGSTCVERAVERLRHFEPPEGYWLAFSGGKDSVCLKALADLAGVKYDAHYSITPDPPPLLRFIKRHHPDVTWERHPKYRNIYEGIVANGLPMRTTRWCCKEFKHRGGVGRLKLLGVRREEGRASGADGSRLTRTCRDTGARAIQPIFDWSAMEVWSFIRSQGLPYCELYDQGWGRLGCVICPFVRGEALARNRERWPWMFNLLRTAFFKLWERKAGNPTYTRWASADDMLEWWLLRDEPYPKEGDYWRMEA